MSDARIFMIAPNFYGIDKSIKSVLESFGFEVMLKNTRNKLEPVETLSLKAAKAFPPAAGVLRPVIKSFLDNDNEEYLSLIRKYKPHALFVIKGETIYPETLAIIKNEMKIPCVIYHWDCPFFSFKGHVVDADRKNNFANGMHLYDHIFSHDTYYVAQIKARGARNVSYLPLATDPLRFRDVQLSEQEKEEFGYDICFVGSPLPNRLEVLESLREFNLGVFGDGWDMWHRLRLKKIPDYYRGTATGDKVLKIYKASKIVLNIHGPEAKCGVNTRTFDIPACGAFELTDYRVEMDRLFKPGEEIAYFKSLDELKRLARFYIENPAERSSVIEKGKAKVLENHTWRHRMREVADVINAAFSAASH